MGFFSKIFGDEEDEKPSILSDKNTKLYFQQAHKLMSGVVLAAYTSNRLVPSLRSGKEKYYLSICFLFGMHGSFIDEYIKNHDKRIAEYLQTIVHLFNGGLNKDISKNLFNGVNIKPNNEGGFSQQNADVCLWYLKQKISFDKPNGLFKVKLSGSHLIHSTILKLSAEDKKKYKKMGSYLDEKKTMPLFTLTKIFEDKKIKLKL